MNHLNTSNQNKEVGPDWCGSVDWTLAYEPKVTGSIPNQGTCLGWGQSGVCKRQQIDVCLAHRCFSRSLSPSLPLFLNIIKSLKKIRKHISVVPERSLLSIRRRSESAQKSLPNLLSRAKATGLLKPLKKRTSRSVPSKAARSIFGDLSWRLVKYIYLKRKEEIISLPK